MIEDGWVFRRTLPRVGLPSEGAAPDHERTSHAPDTFAGSSSARNVR